jgi:hypothetical protein
MLERIIWSIAILNVALFAFGFTFIASILFWVMVSLMIIDIIGG